MSTSQFTKSWWLGTPGSLFLRLVVGFFKNFWKLFFKKYFVWFVLSITLIFYSRHLFYLCVADVFTQANAFASTLNAESLLSRNNISEFDSNIILNNNEERLAYRRSLEESDKLVRIFKNNDSWLKNINNIANTTNNNQKISIYGLLTGVFILGATSALFFKELVNL